MAPSFIRDILTPVSDHATEQAESRAIHGPALPAYPPQVAQDRFAVATYLRAQPSSLDATVAVWEAARAARKAARDAEVRAALAAIRAAGVAGW